MRGNAASRLPALFSSRRSGVLAALCIVALTGVGGALIWDNYQRVETYTGYVRNPAIRGGIIALSDAYRLKDVITQSVGQAAFDESALRQIVRASDIIHIRRESLSRGTASPIAADDFQNLLGRLGDVLEIGDSIGGGALKDPAEALSRINVAVDRLRRATVRYLDGVDQLKADVLAVSSVSLKQLTFFLSTLLFVLCGAVIATLILLRREISLRKESRTAEKRINNLAYFDQSTGLANRVRFYEHLNRRLESRSAISVLFLDLDNFKAINDTHGHAGGDEVLRAVAERLQSTVEALGGIAARLGGDEFASILMFENAERLSRLSERILRMLETPVSFNGAEIEIRGSIGLVLGSTIPQGTPGRLNALTAAADFALYEAKAAGRGVYRFFDGQTAKRMRDRRALIDAIPVAIAAGEFKPYFQPKADLETGRVIGFEALVRWERDGTVVQPGEFLSLAEQTRSILALDIAILHAACEQLASWNRRLALPLSVSVNLSTLHFRSENVVEAVRSALQRTGLSPANLVLEITETVLIEDWSTVQQILARLKGLGVRISLDDFGTGYSSLAYLRKIDADELKIDRSFVTDIERSTETGFLLDAIVDMAQSLKMTIVAEGVESKEQAVILRDFGCTYGQGYYWDKPLSAVETELKYIRPELPTRVSLAQK